MGMLSEFKAFAMRGNVIDLPVGGVDFSAYKWILKAAGADGKGEVAIQYGAFFNTLIQFAIVAFAIFLVVKAMNKLIKKEEAAPAPPPADVVLLTEIRDLLKQKSP